MYQVEGKIWVLVRILSSKWTRISVKKVQTLHSTVLSWVLLVRDYDDYQYFKNSNTQYDFKDRSQQQDRQVSWQISM